MKTNENEKSKISQLKINDAFKLENGVLNVDELMKVEGGVDNDEDGCISRQCASSSKTCYTGV